MYTCSQVTIYLTLITSFNTVIATPAKHETAPQFNIFRTLVFARVFCSGNGLLYALYTIYICIYIHNTYIAYK